MEFSSVFKGLRQPLP